jgi:hypothetical protein
MKLYILFWFQDADTVKVLGVFDAEFRAKRIRDHHLFCQPASKEAGEGDYSIRPVVMNTYVKITP